MNNKYLKKIKTSGRLFFVSDLHGEIDVLLAGLHDLGFKSGVDTVVCAGDLIDRGTNSWKTALHFLCDTTGSFHTVLGNHDVFSFQNYQAGERDLWVLNGGIWAFQERQMEELEWLAENMSKLPYAVEVEHQGDLFGVTHASVPQDFHCWEEFKGVLSIGNERLLSEIVWDREFVEYSKCNDFKRPLDGVKYTIHGHTPVKEPLLVGNRWHIDTGLVYGKYLTIAEVVDGKLEFHKYKGE